MKKIEITEEEFIELTAKAVADEKDIPAIVGMAFLMFSAKLTKKMFHSDEKEEKKDE